MPSKSRFWLIVGVILAAMVFPSVAVSVCPWDTPPPESLPIPLSVVTGYSVAGSVQSGSLSMKMDMLKSYQDPATEVLTSNLFGHGTIQFAAEGLLTGTTMTSSNAAMLGSGRLTGSSGAFGFVASEKVNLSDPNVTANLSYVPICSKVQAISSFDITQGQGAIETTLDVPVPGMKLSQSFALQGDGLGTFIGGYNTKQGYSVTNATTDELYASTKVIGKGIEFAGKFDYSAL